MKRKLIASLVYTAIFGSIMIAEAIRERRENEMRITRKKAQEDYIETYFVD